MDRRQFGPDSDSVGAVRHTPVMHTSSSLLYLISASCYRTLKQGHVILQSTEGGGGRNTLLRQCCWRIWSLRKAVLFDLGRVFVEKHSDGEEGIMLNNSFCCHCDCLQAMERLHSKKLIDSQERVYLGR